MTAGRAQRDGGQDDGRVSGAGPAHGLDGGRSAAVRRERGQRAGRPVRALRDGLAADQDSGQSAAPVSCATEP
ncbi:hypothetical protein [Kitasatospora sp. NPDC058190]|uniref:hypothetical protein n=1 Tax=Kitasatospora sp. NPDC058190 TaxID=3346371 RepID=UPI0036D7C7FB